MTTAPIRDGRTGPPPLRFDHRELAGAVGDLGVLVPIAVALIVTNGLSPTAVLVPAGLLYVGAGFLYRLPVPVQPLKAFGAIAIAEGFGADEIAAGALLMGAIFLVLGGSGLVDRAAKVFPHPIIRGVQLSVGLLFCKLAWNLTTNPPASFTDHTRSTWWLVAATVTVAVVAVLLRNRAITLVLLALAVVGMIWHSDGLTWGPSGLDLPSLGPDAFAAAAVALVLPQLPLTFANSCLATADVARRYFGEAASRVRAGRLAMSLGVANLLAGSMAGMPICHGAGGMTAHRSFGARTGGAPIALGSTLLVLATTIGAGLSALLAGFPLPILAGLLMVAGLLHITLLRDLQGGTAWAFALGVGLTGFLTNLAIALAIGLALWWLLHVVISRRA